MKDTAEPVRSPVTKKGSPESVEWEDAQEKNYCPTRKRGA